MKFSYNLGKDKKETSKRRLHRLAFSSNSLFAIPANQEFVYVHTGSTESSDMLGYMARKLIQSCKVSSGGSTSRSLASLDSNVATDDTEEGKTKTKQAAHT